MQKDHTEDGNVSEPATDADFGSSAAGRLGGQARARALTKEQRQAIARRAAEARWEKAGVEPVPRATHTGALAVGDVRIECAVLEDDRRVLSQRGFMSAIGFRHGGAIVREVDQAGAVLPFFLAQKSLRPFIGRDLLPVLLNPIRYANPSGGGYVNGVLASIIPQICEVWLKARDAGVLRKSQLRVASKADILMRGLAHVGILALVDEATGYQADRARDALARILEEFVAKELQPWVKTFKWEFYEQLFRLRHIEFDGKNLNRAPRYIGHDTNNLIYKRLAPGVLDELRKLNPPDSKGQRKNKHHMHLTRDKGHPKLEVHIEKVTMLMRAFDDWDEFKKRLDRALPKQTAAPLFDHLDTEESGPRLPSPHAS